MAFTREQVHARLDEQIKQGKAIVGAGAGTGISAKCAQNGKVDMIIIYNSGRYRMAGRGSLAGLMPYGDANAIVMDMAREVLPIAKDTPVMAGVCGTDPFRDMKYFVRDLINVGFSGVQNFPTVGLIDGKYRANLEETGMGYSLEVDMIAEAHKQGLFTTPYVFNVEDAENMTKAGADCLVAHMGLTTKGSIGAVSTLTLDDCVPIIQEIHDAAKKINPDIKVICHGGPIAEPEDAAYVLGKLNGVVGFFGASSIERLPTEIAIKEQVEDFKKIKL
jgi:predicted TIM-barrel enzyme